MMDLEVDLSAFEDEMTDLDDTICVSPAELRAFYCLKECYVMDIVEAAMVLDEDQRQVALHLLRGMQAHHRRALS